MGTNENAGSNGSGAVTREPAPSWPASIGGFLRPGRDTFREAAAGSSLVSGLAVVVAATVVVSLVRRRRS